MNKPTTTATIYAEDHKVLEDMRIDHILKTHRDIKKQDFLHLVIMKAKGK